MCGHVGTIACTCLWKQKGGNGVFLQLLSTLFLFLNWGDYGRVVSAVSTEDRRGHQIC